MTDKHLKNKHLTSSEKKTYKSPSLTHFGTVGELTSGGSAGDDEMKKMKNPAKRA